MTSTNPLIRVGDKVYVDEGDGVGMLEYDGFVVAVSGTTADIQTYHAGVRTVALDLVDLQYHFEDVICEVSQGSMVDEWARPNNTFSGDNCGAAADFVIQERGSYLIPVCKPHGDAWLKGEPSTKKLLEFPSPVTQDEVDEALASIMAAMK